MVNFAQQRQDSFCGTTIYAPPMESSASSSSMATNSSHQSLSSIFSPPSSFAGSPVSDPGPPFPQTSSNFLPNSFPALVSPTSPTSPTSPEWTAERLPTQEFEGLLPTFDIEKYGDPRIRPETYYDFKVGKKESYFQLKPGYCITPNFPIYKPIEITKFKTGKSAGRNQYPCRVPSCTANPFTRHYDLERHFRSIHLEKADMYCDYKNCPHKDAFRKDHCREHYREYHLEDLMKRNDPKLEEFLGKRSERIKDAWWRCSKCLGRVKTREQGYKCNSCKQSCETERQELRKKLIEDKSYLTGCGNCQNMWIPHETDPTQWVECPTCQGPSPAGF